MLLVPRIYGPDPDAPNHANGAAPRIPRSSAQLRNALRRPSFLASIGALVMGLALLTALLIAMFSPPPVPSLTGETEPYFAPAISFDKPVAWTAWARTPDLSEPLILFAPQVDEDAPPVTITIDAINVTDDFSAVAGEEFSERAATVELLRDLVRTWGEEAGRGPYEVSETAYNVIDSETGLALAGVMVEWADPAPYTPTSIDALVPAPLGTPAPTPAPGEVPVETPAPTPTPLPSAVPGVEMMQWQMVGLPDGPAFVDAEARRALVVTLSWPTSLPDERVAQAQDAFVKLVTSLRLGG